MVVVDLIGRGSWAGLVDGDVSHHCHHCHQTANDKSDRVQFLGSFHPSLESAMLCGDRVRLLLVCRNLLDNAVKHTHAGIVHWHVDFAPDEETAAASATDTATGAAALDAAVPEVCSECFFLNFFEIALPDFFSPFFLFFCCSQITRNSESGLRRRFSVKSSSITSASTSTPSASASSSSSASVSASSSSALHGAAVSSFAAVCQVSVSVSVSGPGRVVRLTLCVRDTGAGVDLGSASLFQPFHGNVTQGYARLDRHSGLGLVNRNPQLQPATATTATITHRNHPIATHAQLLLLLLIPITLP